MRHVNDLMSSGDAVSRCIWDSLAPSVHSLAEILRMKIINADVKSVFLRIKSART